MRQFIFFSMIIITGIALGYFGQTLVHATAYAPEADALSPADLASTSSASKPFATKVATKAVVDNPSYPSRLTIPSLNIDANVQKVGLTAKGNMGIPSNFTDVAWYRYGTVPGQMGSAVIDGHVDNGLSLAGVFKHLADIKVGDDIYTTSKSGARTHFKVTGSEYYDYQAVPTDLIFNEKDARILRLITCNGDWVSQDRTYDKRLVVTAVKVD